MNDATLSYFRMLADEMGCGPKPMTAREMAETPHDLFANGEMARTRKGIIYRWDEEKKLWVY